MMLLNIHCADYPRVECVDPREWTTAAAVEPVPHSEAFEGVDYSPQSQKNGLQFSIS